VSHTDEIFPQCFLVAAMRCNVVSIDSVGAQTETLLYAFRGLKHGDGANPVGLMRDASGNFFLARRSPVAAVSSGWCGIVFELSPGGVESGFMISQEPDPQSELVEDAAGYLYGTTRYRTPPAATSTRCAGSQRNSHLTISKVAATAVTRLIGLVADRTGISTAQPPRVAATTAPAVGMWNSI